MDTKSTNDNEKQCKPTRPVLFLWIIPLLLLILLTGITLIGVYLVEKYCSSLTSQMIGLGTLVTVMVAILLLVGILRVYYSIRYMQIPAWRWIACGFKGEPGYPHLPWLRKSEIAKAKSMINKRQRACMWLGNICSVVGTILIINGVVWRWIFRIRGDRNVGRIPFKLLLAGAFILIAVSVLSGSVGQLVRTMGQKKDKGHP